MNKETLIKIAALLLVAAFVIEMVAFGAIRLPGGTGGSTGSTSGSQFELSANATVASFDPSLLVFGKTAQIDSVASLLKSSGQITYAVPVDENTTAYNLGAGANQTAIAIAFSDAGATVLAGASLQLPAELNVTLANGSVANLGGASLKNYIDARILPGSIVGVRFQAAEKNGALAGWGSVTLVPLPASFNSSAQVMNVTSNSYVISIPWDQRRVGKSDIEDGLSTALNATARYSERSFLKPKKNLTSQDLAAISRLNLSYVTRVAPESISISTDFTNSSQITSDLGKLAELLEFPNSTAQVDAPIATEDAHSKIDYVMQGFNVTYSVSDFSTIGVRIPGNAVGYIIPSELRDFELLGQGSFSPGENISLDIWAKAAGNVVAQLQYANVIPQSASSPNSNSGTEQNNSQQNNGANQLNNGTASGNQSFNMTEYLKCTNDTYCEGIAQTISKCPSTGKCVNSSCVLSCIEE